MELTLRAGSRDRLTRHVSGQLAMLYPLSEPADDARLIGTFVPKALRRMGSIVDAVHCFRPGYFDHLNTLQYASFLYLLGNEIWSAEPECDAVDRLFGLNRMVSGLELFPAVRLPEPFFLSHALGAVLGNVTYGRRLVIFQNVTVGRIGDSRPHLEDQVVLFAGASVTGSSIIGTGSVVAAATQVHNMVVPPASLVTTGPEGTRIQPLRRDYQSLYFR